MEHFIHEQKGDFQVYTIEGGIYHLLKLVEFDTYQKTNDSPTISRATFQRNRKELKEYIKEIVQDVNYFDDTMQKYASWFLLAKIQGFCDGKGLNYNVYVRQY